jgi:hypothetical protein
VAGRGASMDEEGADDGDDYRDHGRDNGDPNR